MSNPAFTWMLSYERRVLSEIAFLTRTSDDHCGVGSAAFCQAYEVLRAEGLVDRDGVTQKGCAALVVRGT